MDRLNVFDDLRLTPKNINSSNTIKSENNSSSTHQTMVSGEKLSVRDEFVKAKRKNGLFEKFYNWLKNVSGVGLGSKKVEQEIVQYEQGAKSEDEVRENIKKYASSQYNAKQVLGDVASITAGMGAYSTVDKYLKLFDAHNKLQTGYSKIFKNMLSKLPKMKGVTEFFSNMTKVKRISIALFAAASISSFTKNFVLSLNNIGSKAYKSTVPKDKEHKAERKADKKALRKEKRRETFKNMFTGALNGFLGGLANVAGGIVGVPLVLLSNLGLRYISSPKDKEDKHSIKDFADKFKDNAVMNTVGSLAVAIPLFMKARYNKVFSKNLDKVVGKLKDVKLQEPFSSTKTAYSELKDMLLDSPKLSEIISSNVPVEQKIANLIDENIFAAKFIQNAGNWDILTRALKESCPPSRTIEDARKIISQTFGSKYEVSKLLGVGTVAESYLAKNTETGKEVCIKLLKEGMNLQKINADKEKMIDIIKANITDSKELKYYIDNINDLASAISKEVDFENELLAAKELAKFSKYANVVIPLELKDGIYVMEKAPGISLKTLQDVTALEASKARYNKLLGKLDPNKNSLDVGYKSEIESIDKRIAEIRAKSPDFATINITPEEIDRLLAQYIKAQTEQFDSIYKTGKVLHGDIHPGNVFVDLKALKSGNGNALTLIDTGNTINLSMEQARNALKLNQYIKYGNVKDISSYVIEGALLPEGMTQQAAIEIMEKELSKVFFDNKTSIGYMNNDSLLALASNIMRKHNIIPGSTQLNLEKAKHSAEQSFQELFEAFIDTKYSIMDTESKKDKALIAMAMTKDLSSIGMKLLKAKKLQELQNMSQYSLNQVIKNSNNPNMLKTNSEDYLTYKVKQSMSSNFDTNFGM